MEQGMASRRGIRSPHGGVGGGRRVMGSHALLLLQAAPYVTGHYVCHVCWERGSGPLYHCPECQFDVHTTCAGVGSQQTHFSHFEHPLLLKSVGGEVVCDGCGDSNAANNNNSVYRCSRCDFDLCPLCVRAPRYLLHISHPHVLVLSRLDGDADELGNSCQCDGCGQRAWGMMYRCTSCNFDLHQSCVSLPLKPFHPKHPEHPLTLLCREEDRWTSFTCNSCGQEGRGWAYTCSICMFYLHPNCGKIHHALPRNSSNGGGQGQYRHIEPIVVHRANLQDGGLWPERDFDDRHHALISSPSTLNGNLHYHNRDYSSSLQPISPYPHNSHSNSLERSHSYNNYPPLSRTLSYNSTHGGEFYNGNGVSSNAIVQALASRLTPLSPRDADAVDRVMGMLRHTGSPPYT